MISISALKYILFLINFVTSESIVTGITESKVDKGGTSDVLSVNGMHKTD